MMHDASTNTRVESQSGLSIDCGVGTHPCPLFRSDFVYTYVPSCHVHSLESEVTHLVRTMYNLVCPLNILPERLHH